MFHLSLVCYSSGTSEVPADKIQEQKLEQILFTRATLDPLQCATSSAALECPFDFNIHAFDDNDIWWDVPDTWNNVLEDSEFGKIYGGVRGDWDCLFQGDLETPNGDFSQRQTPSSENRIHSSILDPAQDAVPSVDVQGWDRALSPKRSSVQGPELFEPSVHHPNKPLSSGSSVTSRVDDSYTSVYDPTPQSLTPSKGYKLIVPELESCQLCPYRGSAHGIAYVVTPLLVGDAEQLMPPTEDISRRITMTDHLVLLFHASDRVSPAASRCSKTKEAEHATDSNLVRLSPRSSFNAAAAGKSGVGQTLSRVTEPVSQKLGVSTNVTARHSLRTSRDWRTTTTGIIWARKVDLHQIARNWRDDWTGVREGR